MASSTNKQGGKSFICWRHGGQHANTELRSRVPSSCISVLGQSGIPSIHSAQAPLALFSLANLQRPKPWIDSRTVGGQPRIYLASLRCVYPRDPSFSPLSTSASPCSKHHGRRTPLPKHILGITRSITSPCGLISFPLTWPPSERCYKTSWEGFFLALFLPLALSDGYSVPIMIEAASWFSC